MDPIIERVLYGFKNIHRVTVSVHWSSITTGKLHIHGEIFLDQISQKLVDGLNNNLTQKIISP